MSSEEQEIKTLWLDLASKVDEETYDKIWHLAVTQGSDAVVDYLDLEGTPDRRAARRLWITSELSTIYDFSLPNNPFRD